MKTRSKIAIPQDYIEEIFDVFLFEDPSKLHFLSSKVNDPYLFWQKVFSFNKDWEVFAELSLRYSCSFATESIVERYLSIQKKKKMRDMIIVKTKRRNNETRR